MKQGCHTYKAVNTMGMSQLDLILTVYGGAINFLDRARSAFEAGKMSEGRALCERARSCIVHLYTTLDMEKGQAIAAQLGHLYAYMIEQLDLAVARQSIDLLGEIKKMLETIREGWESLKETEAARSRGTAGSSGASGPQATGGGGGKSPMNENRVTISA